MALGSLGTVAGAQGSPTGDGVATHLETRAELEAQAKEAEAQHRTGEAFLLRARLTDGDFQEGDRILFGLVGGNQLIGMPGTGSQMDTLVVRTGKMIRFPNMADLSLAGVLRSELAERITAHLAKYLQNPVVRVSPLLRIGVIGHVLRQGFYYTSADVLLPDLLMQAGGLSADGDLKQVTIHRGADVIWKAQDVQTALSDGLSLDRLHLRAGDQIEVGAVSHFAWTTVLQVAGTLAAVFVAVRQVSR